MVRNRLIATTCCIYLVMVACACNMMQSAVSTPEATSAEQQPIVLAASPTPEAISAANPTVSPTSTPGTASSNQADTNKPCTVQTGWVKYTVVQGDTLNSIAQRVGLTSQALATANCLTNPNVLAVGQVLYVPKTPAPPATTSTQPRIGNLAIAAKGVNATDHKVHVDPNSSLVFHVDGIAALAKVEFNTSPNGRSTAIIGTINTPAATIDLPYKVTERPGSDLLILAVGYGKNGETVQTNVVWMHIDGDTVGFQVGQLSVSPATMQNGNPADLLVAPNSTVTLTVAIHDAVGVNFFTGTSPAEVTSSQRKSLGYLKDTQDNASAQILYQVPGTIGSVIFVQAEAYSVFESAISGNSPVIKLTVAGTAPSPVPTLTPTSVPATNLLTYTNTKFGYSFQYPAGRTLAGTGTADYVTLADQISINVTSYDPQQAKGDGPVIESTEPIKIGNYSATRLKGYIGSVGGGIPQHYESVVFAHAGSFYIFTVNELKNGVVLPADRQLGPIPADALAMFYQVLATMQFLN